MAHIIDFQRYKEKKKQELNDILISEQMTEDMQMLIDQILEQTPLLDSDGNYHFKIDLDDK